MHLMSSCTKILNTVYKSRRLVKTKCGTQTTKLNRITKMTLKLQNFGGIFRNTLVEKIRQIKNRDRCDQMEN